MSFKTIISKLLLFIGRFFECFFAAILVYFVCYWSLSRIPINNGPIKAKKEITIYVTSNGVHTDFVVPIEHQFQDWSNYLDLKEEFQQDSTRNWIAIGWGDKNFFLKTKDWGDLTVGTALKATFGLGTGAVHVVQRNEPNANDANTIKLQLSKDQYLMLVSYIKNEIKKDSEGLSRIKEHPYSKFDFFFDANRSYSMWYTCNSWTNSGLKISNQKACLWTPFKDGIFEKYGK